MAAAPLISLSNVGKDYPVVSTAGSRLRTIWNLLSHDKGSGYFTALDDINIEVYPGQSLGLIGENGAGKSTLLKIIAGVVKASRGEVKVNARIGALLELGAGFHPEYTGRENIYLATALMGMSMEETESSLDAIIGFADIGEHIDQPIKHYSSGMVVRLGFAVATAMTPEVLITDEVLAVGDESFQKKCIKWMEAYLEKGGTLLLCSHSMFHIQKLCSKALWLQHGQVRRYGDALEVSREYLAYHEEKNAREQSGVATQTTRMEKGEEYALRKLWLENDQRQQVTSVQTGQDVTICGEVYSPDDRPPAAGIGIVKLDGIPIYGVVSDIDGFVLEKAGGDNMYGFRLRMQALPLLPGKYIVRAHAMDPEGLRCFDTVEHELQVSGQTRELGVCRLRHTWERDPGAIR